MGLENVLHMNEGNGESSYANNSTLQKAVILKAQPFLEKTVKEIMCSAIDKFPQCLKIVDLGCSSGQNSLFVMSKIIDNAHAVCEEKNVQVPEFQVFLNDLPTNDFNTMFKLLPPYFYEKLKKEKGDNFRPCFVAGVPGSFYERLFPTASLHFVHSSISGHWLSQVPEILESNKGNVYIAKSSPPNVYEAYMKQFVRDFSTFLRVRSEEIIANGRMLITFCGRKSADPTSEDSCFLWNMLAKSLFEMVDQGLLGEADSNSFNIPMYFPSKDELKAIIVMDGSFNLDSLESFELNWDVRKEIDDRQLGVNKDSSGMFLAKTIRASTEPLLVSHFGNSFIDNIFESYARHADEHLSREKPKFFNIVISLIKK